MQKERISPKKAYRHRQTMRWLWRHSNYITAAGVFFLVVVVVVVLAAGLTVKGEQGAGTARTAAGTGTETTLAAGIINALDKNKSQPAEQPTYESMIASHDWGAEDAELLLKIAMAEAEGETTEGKAMVMLVVLNRTWSEDFPDSIEDVIFQTDPKRQFSVTAEDGRWWTTTPDKDCMVALELVESGWDNSWGALYFESSGKEDTWHSRNLDFLFQLGNHKFYK